MKFVIRHNRATHSLTLMSCCSWFASTAKRDKRTDGLRKKLRNELYKSALRKNEKGKILISAPQTLNNPSNHKKGLRA